MPEETDSRERGDLTVAPTYRILSVPIELSRDLIDSQDQTIRNLLKAPPQVRQNGFGFRGVDSVRPPDGLEGTGGRGENHIILTYSGYLQLRVPLDGDLFQWLKEERGFADKD